jgi:branched-chain amino acid transport system ATP-binding protein
MLSARNMRKSFNGFTAVADVSLDVPAQAITAVIGPNGAGKSTLFNLLTGHVRADAGSVAFEGRDITGAAPHAICRMGIGRSFQHTNIFRKLTVLENVRVALIAHHRQARNFWDRSAALYRDEAMQILESLGLARDADAVSDSLSHGNQKQLELGIALASDPRLLLLDEPTAGMSATETREAIQLLERIVRDRKLTLLFTEHDMDVVFSIAQKIAVLHQGRLIAEGSPAEVRNHAEVRRVYLGGAS